MSDYDTDLEEAARRYHLSWCDHPHCVHMPFPEDREHVGAVLSITEVIYTERDLLRAACHHLLGVVSALERSLVHLDDLRAHLARAHATIAEALG